MVRQNFGKRGGCPFGSPLFFSNQNRQYDKLPFLIYKFKPTSARAKNRPKFKIMQKVNYLSCHYHKVESLTWLCTRKLMQRVIIARVAQGADMVRLELTRDECENLREFLEQMDIAYLHPRRDSLHVSLLASQYSSLNVSPETVRMAPHTANPLMKKTKSLYA